MASAGNFAIVAKASRIEAILEWLTSLSPGARVENAPSGEQQRCSQRESRLVCRPEALGSRQDRPSIRRLQPRKLVVVTEWDRATSTQG